MMRFTLTLLMALMFNGSFLFAQNIEELCASQTIDGTVVNFTRFEDELYATGFFQTLCDQSVNYVAKFENSEWQPVGSGLTDPGHALREIDGQLYAARYEESIDSNWVQRWNGSEWENFGEGVYLTTASGFSELPNIYDLIEYDGKMVVCGEFDRAGSLEISGIMAWNGSTWEDLGGGLSGNIPNTAPVMFPHQMLIYEGDLLVCGNFATAGGVTVNGLARWNGTEWQAMGAGFNNTVYGLGIYGGELYAGGAFTQSGSTDLNRIAKWNGTEWVSPGFGFVEENGFDFIFVHTFVEVEGNMYVGGGLKKIMYDDGSEEPCGGIIGFNDNNVFTFNGGVSGNDIEAIIFSPPYSLLVGGGVFGNGYLGETIIGGTPTFEEQYLPLEIFPNPVGDHLSFSGSTEMGTGTLRIFSSRGQEVFRQYDFQLENALAVCRLLSGTYFVSFSTGEDEFRGAFLKR